MFDTQIEDITGPPWPKAEVRAVRNQSLQRRKQRRSEGKIKKRKLISTQTKKLKQSRNSIMPSI